MKKRFIVKKVKVVWRNSMIAGNPIVRSFQKFGVYDRDWENDRFYCPRPSGEFVNQMAGRKYRVVVDDEELAKNIAARLEELLNTVPNAKRIDFNGLSSYVSDVNNITIRCVEC